MAQTVLQIAVSTSLLKNLNRYLNRIGVGMKSRSRFIENLVYRYIGYQIQREKVLREIEAQKDTGKAVIDLSTIPPCPCCSLPPIEFIKEDESEE